MAKGLAAKLGCHARRPDKAGEKDEGHGYAPDALSDFRPGVVVWALAALTQEEGVAH